MKKRILAGLMSLCLLVSVVPMEVKATSGDGAVSTCEHEPYLYEESKDGKLYCADATEHYNVCSKCGEKYNYKDHEILGSRCNVCEADLNRETGSHVHDLGSSANVIYPLGHVRYCENGSGSNGVWEEHIASWIIDGDSHRSECEICHCNFVEQQSHIDENEDKLCDACSVTVEKNDVGSWIHLHDLSGEKKWVNENVHSKKCTGCNWKEDEEHEDLNNDYICDICNGYAESDYLKPVFTAKDDTIEKRVAKVFTQDGKKWVLGNSYYTESERNYFSIHNCLAELIFGDNVFDYEEKGPWRTNIGWYSTSFNPSLENGKKYWELVEESKNNENENVHESDLEEFINIAEQVFLNAVAGELDGHYMFVWENFMSSENAKTAALDLFTSKIDTNESKYLEFFKRAENDIFYVPNIGKITIVDDAEVKDLPEGTLYMLREKAIAYDKEMSETVDDKNYEFTCQEDVMAYRQKCFELFHEIINAVQIKGNSETVSSSGEANVELKSAEISTENNIFYSSNESDNEKEILYPSQIAVKSSAVSEEDQETLKDEINNSEISENAEVEYVELSLIDKIADDRKVKMLDGSSITVTIDYPASYDKNDTFVLYHLKEDGGVETITPNMNETDENGLAFELKSFSPYALVSQLNKCSHVQNVDSWRGEVNKHFPVCGICGEAYGDGENHVNDDKDDYCDVCGTGNLKGGTTHEHSNLVWDVFELEHVQNCEDCSMQINHGFHNDDKENPDGKCNACGASVTLNTEDESYKHTHEFGKYQIDRFDHISICSDCGCKYEWKAHRDKDSNLVCVDCNTKLTKDNSGNLIHNHTISSVLVNPWEHENICKECGERFWVDSHIDADMDSKCDDCAGALHSHIMSRDFMPYEDGHAKYCVYCYLPYVSTKTFHDDKDDEKGYCDGCYLDVKKDESTNTYVHKAESTFWQIEEFGHYEVCSTCWSETTGIWTAHKDDEGIGRCDECKASLTVDDDGLKHIHEEQDWVYESQELHSKYCADCKNLIMEAEHTDIDNNDVCDDCKEKIDTFNVVFKEESNAATKILLDAMSTDKKSINSAKMEELISTDAEEFAALYGVAYSLDDSVTAKLDVYEGYETSEEMEKNSELKAELNYVKNAIGKNISRVFWIDTVAQIVLQNGESRDYSCDKIHELGELAYTITLNKHEVKSNRIWYVYTYADDGQTFKQIAVSKKGASFIDFAYAADDTGVILAYEDEMSGTGSSSSSSSSSNKTHKEETKAESKPTLVETIPAPSTGTKTETTANSNKTTTNKSSSTTVKQESSAEAAIPATPVKADTTIVEIVANEKVVEAVKENVVVTETIAVVNEKVMEAVLEATKENEAVIIPLAQVSKEVVEKVEISMNAVESIVYTEKDVVIELTDITLKLDAKALGNIANQASGKNIEICVVKAEKEQLSDSQLKGLGNKEVAMVVTAQILSDGEVIGNFKGGKATIKIPFQPEDGKDGNDYVVYFIGNDGKMEKIPNAYVDGHMVFTTGHFSDYVITYEGSEEATESSDTEKIMDMETVVETENDSVSFPVVPVIAVAVIIAAVAVILFLKKKK